MDWRAKNRLEKYSKERQRIIDYLSLHDKNFNSKNFNMASGDLSRQVNTWASGIWKKYIESKHQLDMRDLAFRQNHEIATKANADLQDADYEIMQLEQAIKDARKRSKEETRKRKTAEENLATALAAHSGELDRVKEKADTERESLKATARAERAHALEKQSRKFESLIRGLDHKIEQIHRESIRNPADVYRNVSDTVLEMHFRQIKTWIEQLCNVKLFANVGNTGMAGLVMPWHIVRWRLWSHIFDGFFAIPYGFGAFGREGVGRDLVWDLYVQFAKMMEARDIGPLDHHNLSYQMQLFAASQHANSWRASTFNAIALSMEPAATRTGRSQPSTSYAPANSPISDAFFLNRNDVQARIMDTLRDSYVAHELEPLAEAKVSDIVRVAASLALQLGCQRSRVELRLPQQNDEVSYDEFNASSGEEPPPGESTMIVDICLSPCFVRLGDGRQEMGSPVVIFPGEVISQPLSAPPPPMTR